MGQLEGGHFAEESTGVLVTKLVVPRALWLQRRSCSDWRDDGRMRLSKLERYYQAEFGPRDDPDDADPRPVRPSRAEDVAPRRRGPGLFKILLLVSSLASFGTFVVTALMPCGAGSRPAFLPQGLVAAACARQDLFGQLFTLQAQLRSIATGMR